MVWLLIIIFLYNYISIDTKYTGSRPRHAVRMRGLPFSVTERDIQDFFSPLIPIHISIESDSSGRLSGEGEISFGSHEDAEAAMKKDRGHIGMLRSV